MIQKDWCKSLSLAYQRINKRKVFLYCLCCLKRSRKGEIVGEKNNFPISFDRGRFHGNICLQLFNVKFDVTFCCYVIHDGYLFAS